MTGKSVRMAPNGMPKQIAIGPEPLLIEPVQVTVAGHTVTDSDAVRAPVWTVDATGEHASYGATSRFAIAGRTKTEIRVEGEAWFDGLMTIELSIPVLPEALKGKPISYRISLSRDLGRFLHRDGPVGKRNTDLAALPEPLVSPYVPFLWFSNDSPRPLLVRRIPRGLEECVQS